MGKIKNAFTLAEILIVLVIIGVLTMILLPMAFQSSPDEDVMKFKKGYNTLGAVIRELVSSDKYYQDGDLGIKAGGELVDSPSQLCESFADIITTKKKNCPKEGSSSYTSLGNTYATFDTASWDADGLDIKPLIDESCKKLTSDSSEQIVTTDGIIYFDPAPGVHFGIKGGDYFEDMEDREEEDWDKDRYFGGRHKDEFGFDRIYKIFCMDIDGINKGEAPFAFGIRADGKLYNGQRADEWLNKKIQKE